MTDLGVLAGNAAQDSQWEGDDSPDDEDDNDCAEGQGSRGSVDDGHRVQEAERDQQRSAEQGGCQ